MNEIEPVRPGVMMKAFFQDILDMEDVFGLMLFSFDGKLLFKAFPFPPGEDPETRDWWPLFTASLGGVKEADLLFDHRRLYIRETEMGYLMVLMGSLAPTAMLRLNCDMLLPKLKEKRPTKGLLGIFKKRS
jgi:hypothetical protein